MTWTVPTGLTIKVTGTFSLGASAHLVVMADSFDAGIARRGAGNNQFAYERGLAPAVATVAQILTAARGGGAGSARHIAVAAAGGGAIVIRAQGGITIASGASIEADGAIGGVGPSGGFGGGGGASSSSRHKAPSPTAAASWLAAGPAAPARRRARPA